MKNTLTLAEKREQVTNLLRPDELRRHRVSDSLVISDAQLDDLESKALLAAKFARSMSALSNTALAMDALDPESRLIRSLCATEPLFQARKRGEVSTDSLLDPTLTKVDLVMGEDGFSIVEIEPGKVRGLGYGRMVREQVVESVGIGSELGLQTIMDDKETSIVLSDYDRFHIPEIGILAKFVGGLTIVNQAELTVALPNQAILASALKGSQGAHLEEKMRNFSKIVSDRRPDLESKGALALVHNTGENDELEKRLLEFFSRDSIEGIRASSPVTHHLKLLSKDRRLALSEQIASGNTTVFGKPMTDSGTRGMITPDDTANLGLLLSQPKQANGFVIQEAIPTIPTHMESMDVINGDMSESDMNLRITIHVDTNGNIIEASVVGSPHEFLAHGGKTSVITSLEPGHV